MTVLLSDRLPEVREAARPLRPASPAAPKQRSFLDCAAADRDFRSRFGTPIPLAHGGLGEVYLALDRSLPGWSVIKTLRSEVDSPATRLLFEAEVVFAARLSAHPHFAQVLSTGRVAGRRYLETRHYGGGTLLQRLGELDMIRLLELLLQVLRALEFGHRLGIVHGDVSESQILLDEDGGNAVLADLGAARVMPGFSLITAMPPPVAGDQVTLYVDDAMLRVLDRIEREVHDRYLVVKLSHAAPERLRDPARPCPVWDVHAVAVILFQALVGYLPHQVAGVAAGDLRAWISAKLPSVEDGLRWAGRLCEPRWPAVERVVDAIMQRLITDARAAREALTWAAEEECWRRRARAAAEIRRRWLLDCLRATPQWRWLHRRRLRAELGR